MAISNLIATPLGFFAGAFVEMKLKKFCKEMGWDHEKEKRKWLKILVETLVKTLSNSSGTATHLAVSALINTCTGDVIGYPVTAGAAAFHHKHHDQLVELLEKLIQFLEQLLQEEKLGNVQQAPIFENNF